MRALRVALRRCPSPWLQLVAPSDAFRRPRAARSVSEGEPAVLNRDCKLLGTVSGRSLFGGADEARVQNAMNDAREKGGGASGATHVVFLRADTKGILNRGNASARAYRCDAKPS
jgi:hypothetical protein